jgi:hypothetical protein
MLPEQQRSVNRQALLLGIHEAPGLVALVSGGWDEAVPVIVLNRRPDVEEIAGAFGAVEGVCMPINVGA